MCRLTRFLCICHMREIGQPCCSAIWQDLFSNPCLELNSASWIFHLFLDGFPRIWSVAISDTPGLLNLHPNYPFSFSFVNHLTSKNRSWFGMRFERTLISYKHLCLEFTVTPIQIEGLSFQLGFSSEPPLLFFLSFKWKAMFYTKPLSEAHYANKGETGELVQLEFPTSNSAGLLWSRIWPSIFQVEKSNCMIVVFQTLGDKLTAI